ncbi:MAG: hypothetical protein PWP15_1468 [Methanothermococcus sp.]|uniref:DUF2096 family protein n=1 Tax=Methanothermococcus TaxID=155862 RepID=UPI00036B2366|nr:MULTISPECIES: DUF2096 family protein [Methanothermococcus]MDK2790959.1 hypothetical protein [Methanothermococcus sp.]MDK2978351.1 hypothetical protein [Bacteroidales bacterium]MDK2987934.1 hypothetical protein [Methanothermococcus sp.]
MKDARGIDKQWVILNELAFKISEERPVPEEVFSRLRIANNVITYYLLDEHASYDSLKDAEAELSRVQGILFGLCDHELAMEYLEKMGKALRNELDVKFPIKKSSFNSEVKSRKDVESIRVKLQKEIQVEILGELSELHGVVFEYSREDEDKVLIDGEKRRVITALKDFSVIWNE